MFFFSEELDRSGVVRLEFGLLLFGGFLYEIKIRNLLSFVANFNQEEPKKK